MSFIKVALFSCYFICFYANSQPLQAFNIDILLKQQQENKGQRWLMLLWSVDCPPCYKELALISELHKLYDLPIVLINTDDNDDVSTERAQIIRQFQLDDLVNLYFIDGKGAYNSYSIDPNWHGELPRSYFIDEQGNAKGQSGLLNKKIIQLFFKVTE